MPKHKVYQFCQLPDQNIILIFDTKNVLVGIILYLVLNEQKRAILDLCLGLFLLERFL